MHSIELRLTLRHFLPHESALLSGLITSIREANRPYWIICDDSSADAVILNANAPDAATSDSIKSEMVLGRPVGQLTLPGAVPAEKAVDAIALSWRDSTRQLLQRLEDELAEAIVWNTLAYAVHQHLTTDPPGGHLWNLEFENTLVAVVDYGRSQLGLHPNAIEFTPDFAEISWVRKPSNARMPEEFVTQPLAQVMWQFAKRSAKDLVPPAYRQQKICLYQLPALRVINLSSAELAVINYLVQRKACTLQEMLQQLVIDPQVLARCVAGLHLAGALRAEKSPGGLLQRLQHFIGAASDPIDMHEAPGFLTQGMMPLTAQPSLV